MLSAKQLVRVLDPLDRVTEVLFGLIMVLTFTGSLSVAEVGRDDVRAMLIGAIGCNLAWGMIDGILYLLGRIAEKDRNFLTLRAVQQASNPTSAQQLIADSLPPVVVSVLQPAELGALQQRLKELPEPTERTLWCKDDWLGAFSVLLLVFLSTFPVVIPFIFIQNTLLALRISNAIAIGMLFVAGYAFGRITGRRPWIVGIFMVFVGSILVGLTIAFGG